MEVVENLWIGFPAEGRFYECVLLSYRSSVKVPQFRDNLFGRNVEQRWYGGKFRFSAAQIKPAALLEDSTVL